VWQFTVDASEGVYVLERPETFAKTGHFAILEPSASAEHVQEELESPEMYGAGNVEVTGGPAATGTGTLLGPVAATGKLTSGSPAIEEVPSEQAAEFTVGQTVEGAGIPAGTTVVAVEGETVTVSANATESGAGVALAGVASKTVTNVATATGAFAVGQHLAAKGVAGATVEAVGAGTLTLSQAPTAAGGVGLGLVVAAPYTVTFKGALTGRPLGLAAKAFFLSGGKAELSEVEVTKGTTDGQVVVTAANLGEAGISGGSEPVRLADQLPAGFEAVSVEGVQWESGSPVECDLATVSCTFKGLLDPFETLEMRIGVKVTGSSGVNSAVVSGGGLADATVSGPVQVGGVSAFGVEHYDLAFEGAGGRPVTQAGSHPFQLTTTVALNSDANGEPVSLPKELAFDFPAGFIGNPTPFTQCTLQQFLTRPVNGQGEFIGENKLGVDNECPASAQVGVAQVTVNDPTLLHIRTLLAPVFNIEPSVGEPARFGFLLPGTPVFIDTSIRTGGDYGITAFVHNLPEVAGLLRSEVTIWGVPGAATHDLSRGFGCIEQLRGGAPNHLPCSAPESSAPPAFLSLPTTCTGPLQSTMRASSWDAPDAFVSRASDPMQALDGCNRLVFEPSISVTPDDQRGSSPTGLTVGVHVPQEESLSANGLTEGEIKNTTVTLPAGVALNAAAAGGLSACSTEQVALQSPAASSCPESSKVGTVEIQTPVLAHPLRGGAFVAAQEANPFGSLVAMYVSAEDPVSGVRVKLAGEVHLDPVTGQLTTTFTNTPQAPFEDFKIHFFGGARGPLATPGICGSYTTDASFAPWSANPPVAASSTFQITSGPNGSPCPGAHLPFTAALAAGSPNINAGAFSPLTTTISREDGNQDIQHVTLHMAPGMSGILAGVPLCPEAQANAGTCSEASRIGETVVSVGLGGDPFTVTGGKVYLTEKYQGAPFGLSIVNPADAGPFHLGKVIVRAKIEVDPATAALTITTGEIPHILKGFPLQIKHVNVLINRPGFTFNPTNCNPLSITGSIGSVEGSSSPVAVPFQVTNCASLAFKPNFAVSTTGRNSKANGAALSVKLTYPTAPFGSQANIRSVKVELPKQLPSRLTTLQKACTNAQFQANPAGCPAASIIGHAKATTPLLPVPLEGPAYFVSHGGEAFPSLIIVLQGYGVTLDLVGTTFISKAGITSSTFKTVPDAPVGSFELTLPQGKFSALAANGNLCTSKLTMPTEFLAQNGAKINQSTPVSVTGCAKKKALTRAQKLAAALKACHKRAKGRRASCRRAAQKKYGSLKKRKPRK
jgi:hypothetical protein